MMFSKVYFGGKPVLNDMKLKMRVVSYYNCPRPHIGYDVRPFQHWLAAEWALTFNPSQLRRRPVAHCHLTTILK